MAGQHGVGELRCMWWRGERRAAACAHVAGGGARGHGCMAGLAPGAMLRRCPCTRVLQVSTVQKFRKGLPEGASVLVCKNNLMKVAIKQTPGWESLAEKGCTVSGRGGRARQSRAGSRWRRRGAR